MSESNLPEWEEVLTRNATRDYLDFAALSERLASDRVRKALDQFDELYPQASGESALLQLQVQLANAMPYDLDQTDLQNIGTFTRSGTTGTVSNEFVRTLRSSFLSVCERASHTSQALQHGS